MSIKTLSIFLISCAICLTSHSLAALPFIDNYSITVSGDNSLKPLLTDELKRQRKNNLKLQQYTQPNKIKWFESKLLTDRLRAEGYYQGKVRASLKDEHITYRIQSGTRYLIEHISLQVPAHITAPALSILGIKEGQPLRAETVLTAKKKLAKYIAEHYCLHRIEVNYHVTVLHPTESGKVQLQVANSPAATFGDITVSGLESIEQSYVIERLPIKKDACFKQQLIDKTQLALIQTNLFTQTNVRIGELKNNAAPVTIEVQERHHRSLSLGAGFESEEGAGITAKWEHRNLLGRAEQMTINTTFNRNLQRGDASITFPHFHHNNQKLTFYSDLEHEETDAFETTLVNLGTEISRKIDKHLEIRLAAEMERSKVIQGDESDHFSLISLPLSLKYDRRDSELNPLTGWLISAQIRPYSDIKDTDIHFLKSSLTASAYLTSNELPWQPTFAIRGALGSISGIDLDKVPANIRYYAGGGGSVRGYTYQSLGDFKDGDPEGGLSFSELSFETRVRWSDNWGGVAFVDGGYAYSDELSEMDHNLHWGTGIGVRYYSNFAPIRFDIAMPIDKRDHLDDDFKIYISIGQAF